MPEPLEPAFIPATGGGRRRGVYWVDVLNDKKRSKAEEWLRLIQSSNPPPRDAPKELWDAWEREQLKPKSVYGGRISPAPGVTDIIQAIPQAIQAGREKIYQGPGRPVSKFLSTTALRSIPPGDPYYEEAQQELKDPEAAFMRFETENPELAMILGELPIELLPYVGVLGGFTKEGALALARQTARGAKVTGEAARAGAKAYRASPLAGEAGFAKIPGGKGVPEKLPSEYYIYGREKDTGLNEFIKVKGKKVKIPSYEEYDIFVHGKTGNWDVTEASTGFKLGSGRTIDEAINETNSLIYRAGGKENLDKMINKQIQDTGLTPRYKPEPAKPLPGQAAMPETQAAKAAIPETPAVRPPTAVPPVAYLPDELTRAKPRYNIGQTSYLPQFESDIDKALFIISQTKRSARDADYLAFVRSQFPDVSETTLRNTAIRRHIKTVVTGQPAGDVIIPDSGIAQKLRGIPTLAQAAVPPATRPPIVKPPPELPKPITPLKEAIPPKAAEVTPPVTRKPITEMSPEELAAIPKGQRAEPIGAIPPRKPPAPPTEGIPSEFPSGRKPGGIQNMKSLTPEDEYQKVVDALTPTKVPFDEKLTNARQELLRHMYDRNYPLRELENITGIPAHKLAQVVPGSTAAGENLIRMHYRPVIESMGKDVKYLEQYMVMMRNQDILARNPGALLPGNVSGWSGTVQALKTFEKQMGPARFAKIRKAAQQLWELNDDMVLKPLLDEGLINPKSYTAIKSSNPHYIPWQREDFMLDIERAFNRPEASVSSTGLKKLTKEGSIRKLDNPLARLEADVIRTQNVIFRNRAARAIDEALQEAGDIAGVKLVDDVGKKAEHSMITDTISYFKDGGKIDKQVPAIYAKVAKAMDWEPTNILSKVLLKASAPLRHGAVTYNPAFLIVNPLRDAMSAFFREKLIPFSPEYFRGWVSAIKKDAYFNEFAETGGLLSGIVDTMRSTEALSRAGRVGSITVKSPKEALFVLPKLIERANITAEQATRLATYRKLRAQGIDKLDAAVRARDVTVDFAKSGITMKVINQIVPFSNAALQGTANTLRTIRYNPKWAAIASAPFVAATIMSRVNNMRYESSVKIPEYEYTNYWVIQVGEYTTKEGDINPIYIKIPKGPQGSLITFPGEALFNVALKQDDRKAVEIILDAALEAGKTSLPVDPTAAGILPPLLKTGVSVSTNQNLFSGMPIVPRREEQLLPEQQYDERTNKIAIALGKKFGISPRKLDFAFKDYLAGGGQTISWLSNLAVEALGYKPELYGEAKRETKEGIEAISNVPVAGRFVGAKGNQQERVGWQKLDRLVDEGNRELAKVPEMNKLGIRISEVGSNIGGYELKSYERAEYQDILNKLIIPAIKEIQGFDDYQSLPDDKKIIVIKKLSDRAREIARERIKQKLLKKLLTAR